MKFLFRIFLFLGIAKSQLMNGDKCSSSNGSGSEKCILLSDCPSALLDLQNDKYPPTCGFHGIEPLVCCSEGITSKKKCLSYMNGMPAFEILEIVGGIQAQPSEFPHMAALGYKDGNRIIWQCGGSLVSEKYVLTAAHCLNSAAYGQVEWVRLGNNNLPSTTSSPTIFDHQVSRRIIHPSYHSPSVYNDIGLIELSRGVPFSSIIKPACLYSQQEISSNLELTATGWGLTQFAGNRSETLQKVRLELFTEQECNTTYGNMLGSRRLKEGIINEEQFCAGARTSDKDTCQGDSGGPLQTYNQSMKYYSIVGITSFGKACGIADVPGVYTRVSYYIPWLESIIWPND